MARARLFKSNQSQAVRLPKDVAFPKDVEEVTIRRVGSTRVIAPIGAIWDDFFDAPGVEIERPSQPLLQTRNDL